MQTQVSDHTIAADDPDIFLDGRGFLDSYSAEEMRMIISSWRQVTLGRASVEQFDALLRDNYPEIYYNNGEE